jgi:hypothetical protein
VLIFRVSLHSKHDVDLLRRVEVISGLRISLTTQLSVNRLARLERSVTRWSGPISVAVYVSNESDVREVLYELTNLARFV